MPNTDSAALVRVPANRRDAQGFLSRTACLLAPFGMAACLLAFSSGGQQLQASRPAPLAEAAEPAKGAAPVPVAAAQPPTPPIASVRPSAQPPVPGPAAEPVSALPLPPPEIRRALRQAAQATGLDPALLHALAWKESRFDRRARNPQSSARGLMQFTEITWLEVVRDFGPQHGLARQAQAIVTDRKTGRIWVRDERSRRYLMALRDNPRHSAVLAAARLEAERPALEAALGRAATPMDLYAVHFLGPAGARRFLTELQRAPNQPVIRVVSADGLERNRNVFITADGRSRRVSDVHGAFAAAIREQRLRLGSLMADAGVDIARR